MKKKMTFALCFCNRGFMPGELIYGARDDMVKAVTDAGYDYIMMDKELTRYGGVETRDEGLLYAKWLKEHEGQYDGVIFSMPIFADENGAITALQDAGVPILMQAYPDEIGKMDFAHRRDAYCGKFSVTDVFCQYNVPFTVLKPHVVHPLSAKFQENLRDFAAICRVVNGMKRFNLGCIGARTTAFKTVRFDEVAMQKNGINVESFDLSEVFEKVRAKADDDAVVLAKLEHLKNYTDFSKVPASNALTLAKVSVVLDEYIEEYHLDALALRCWNEMETYLRICPCVLLSELNDRGIVASCEIDMCSAISMRAMSLASEGPAAVLDWNNNYGDDEDKIILFHCGPVAQSLMAGKGTVTEHKMFAKNDPGSGWGCNEGRIKPMPITISNCQTKDGKIVIYASEAKFTDDPIEDGYFGCGGVAEIPHLQDKCITLAKGGFKPGWEEAMREHEVPDWYIESCRKIKYMFPKAHAVAYLMSAIRLMWYKIYKPQAFYAVYFTVRGDDIDYEAAIGGAAVARAHMEAVKRRLKEEKNAKDEDVLVSLQLVNEMLSRGYEFLPIELGKSLGSKYVVEDDKVRLPFSALKGLGGAAADALERVTIHGEEYISVEELQQAIAIFCLCCLPCKPVLARPVPFIVQPEIYRKVISYRFDIN